MALPYLIIKKKHKKRSIILMIILSVGGLFFMNRKVTKNQTIVIFTAKLARNLLKDGFTIVDIKPDRTDREGKRSVFIFKNETNIEEHIKMYEKK